MHARDLIEVAGLLALNGPLLARGSHPPSVPHLEQYWSASRCRLECWNRALKACANLDGRELREDCESWLAIRATLEEIFTGEILTRVWTAVLVSCDRQTRTNIAEPIARNAMTAHLEVHRRALSLLVNGNGFTTQQAIVLNRVRRRAERWADVLLGGLLHLGDLREFAVEPQRAEDFATDLAGRQRDAGGQHAWRLTLVSLRNAFHTGLAIEPANPLPNARITASILGCFPGELFDSTGIFQSLWMMRMAANTSDAQGMISDLLQPDPIRSRSPTSLDWHGRRI